MEFIKTMKKREFIEMGLKTAAAIFAAFFAIILMESMIYSIQLNALKTKSTSSTTYSNSTIAYCIKEDEDKYFVLYYNEGTEKEWSANKNDYKTKAQCEDLNVKEVVYHAPNAFKFTITPVHYIVMSIFIAGVAGFFGYKFVTLANQYKKIEEEFEKNGTISL